MEEDSSSDESHKHVFTSVRESKAAVKPAVRRRPSDDDSSSDEDNTGGENDTMVDKAANAVPRRSEILKKEKAAQAAQAKARAPKTPRLKSATAKSSAENRSSNRSSKVVTTSSSDDDSSDDSSLSSSDDDSWASSSSSDVDAATLKKRQQALREKLKAEKKAHAEAKAKKQAEHKKAKAAQREKEKAMSAEQREKEKALHAEQREKKKKARAEGHQQRADKKAAEKAQGKEDKRLFGDLLLTMTKEEAHEAKRAQREARVAEKEAAAAKTKAEKEAALQAKNPPRHTVPLFIHMPEEEHHDYFALHISQLRSQLNYRIRLYKLCKEYARFQDSMFAGPISLLIFTATICTFLAGIGILTRDQFLEACITGAACSAVASALTLISSELKLRVKAEMFREDELRCKVLRERVLDLKPTPDEDRILHYQRVFAPLYYEIAIQQAEAKFFPDEIKVRVHGADL